MGIRARTAFQVITTTKNKMLGKVAMVLTLLAALLPMERVEGGTVRSSYFINTPHNQTWVEEEEVKLREGGSVRLQLPENQGPYKWLLNDREVPGETGNFLDIEDFTRDYHNSVVKCIQEKFGGEARLLKIVRLIEDNSLTLNTNEDENKDLDIQDDQPAIAGDQKMKKRLFTCISDSEDADNAGSPKYVWVEGRLETRVTSAKDEKGQTYKCTLLPGGLKKVKQIEKKLKVMSKDLKRFSRTLRKFTAPVSAVT